jgi:hypothetical protein
MKLKDNNKKNNIIILLLTLVLIIGMTCSVCFGQSHLSESVSTIKAYYPYNT